MGGWP
ncbi:Protein of unknown function [Leuconostoc citreum LBAE C11]